VNEFCAAARRALAKIMLFKEQNIVSARSSVDRAANTCCTAADHYYVPRLGSVAYSLKDLGAVHVTNEFIR
jgi:hypothetical protein